MKRCRVLGAGLVAGLVSAPVALAASDPSAPSGTAGGAQGQIDGVQSAGSLPFTGMNLTLILIGGAVLLAAGFLLRRRGSQSTN